MELADFVCRALLDIIIGVQEAQKKTPGGAIVPEGVNRSFQAVEAGISQVQSVEFEITVRADERSGSEAKLSVVAGFLGGGVKGDSGKSGGHSATLKFRIPVLLPTSGGKKENA